jgi:hypothetical protein
MSQLPVEQIDGPDDDQAHDAETKHEELAAERGLIAGRFIGRWGFVSESDFDSIRI